MPKKKRKLSEWQKHVKQTAKDNPDKDFKEIIKKAKKTYKAKDTIKRTKNKTTKKRSVKRIVKKKSRKKRSFTLPIVPVAALIGLPFIRPHPDFGSPYEHYKYGNMDKILPHLLFSLTGVWVGDKDVPKPRFDPIKGANGLKLLIAGLIAHKLASKLGLNRALGQAGVPVLRI